MKASYDPLPAPFSSKLTSCTLAQLCSLPVAGDATLETLDERVCEAAKAPGRPSEDEPSKAMRSAAKADLLFALVVDSCVLEASSHGEAKVKAMVGYLVLLTAVLRQGL